MKTLILDLAPGDKRSYPIYIGSNLLTKADLLAPHIKARRVLIVTNDVVASLYLPALLDSLSEYETKTYQLKDGEAYKSLETVSGIFDTMLSSNCDRDTTVLALGGGVVGDIAGFAAACYQRGVPFIQIPTTLLAQVDSSVGGKTGVNHTLGKNMIGAFYQPEAVIADIDTLASLPPRELSAGLAEVVKYGLLWDAVFLAWLESNIDDLLAMETQALIYAVEKSCAIKAQVVAQDERESGIRALLNLGHTFGHAIETTAGYGKWLHGEAVAAGMVMACQMSYLLGWISQQDVARAVSLIERFGLPVSPPSDMTPAQFLNAMGHDKKVRNNRIRLVLLESLGKAVLVEDYGNQVLQDTLEAFCAAE